MSGSESSYFHEVVSQIRAFAERKASPSDSGDLAEFLRILRQLLLTQSSNLSRQDSLSLLGLLSVFLDNARDKEIHTSVVLVLAQLSVDRALLEESQILKATKQLASLESLAELDSLNTKWGIILDGNVETKMGATSQSSQSKKRPLEEPVGEIAVKKPRIDLTIPVVRASENGANVPKSILSTPNHSGGKKKVSFRDDNLVQERVLSKWLQVVLDSRSAKRTLSEHDMAKLAMEEAATELVNARDSLILRVSSLEWSFPPRLTKENPRSPSSKMSEIQKERDDREYFTQPSLANPPEKYMDTVSNDDSKAARILLVKALPVITGDVNAPLLSQLSTNLPPPAKREETAPKSTFNSTALAELLQAIAPPPSGVPIMPDLVQVLTQWSAPPVAAQPSANDTLASLLNSIRNETSIRSDVTSSSGAPYTGISYPPNTSSASYNQPSSYSGNQNRDYSRDYSRDRRDDDYHRSQNWRGDYRGPRSDQDYSRRPPSSNYRGQNWRGNRGDRYSGRGDRGRPY